MSYLSKTSRRQTPQSEPLPGSGQVANSAGGFSFALDKWAQLDRWLILGSAGGTYYANERDATKRNVDTLEACVKEDGLRVVETIVRVSTEGRAPRQTETIYALAYCAGAEDVKVRTTALDNLEKVCRTATHLFMFLGFVKEHRGLGRGLRRAVGRWYADKPTEKLAYQGIKYRNREGWTHRDVLRIAHVGRAVSSGNPDYPGMDDEKVALLAWLAGKGKAPKDIEIVKGFKKAQKAETPAETVAAITKYPGLPREALRTEHLTDPAVWEALLAADMPMTALIRNLGNMSKAGLTTGLSEATKTIVEQLGDVERLKAARVHPMALLFALKTYASGQGFRGGNSWEVNQKIVDALDGAFYSSFDFVEPTGRNTMLACDISGSMTYSRLADSNVTCMEGAMAMAMVTERVEPWTAVYGFNTSFEQLNVSSRKRLDDNIASLNWRGGGTDCALPMQYALSRGMEVDTFVVYTDNETWAGRVHPSVALEEYRQKMGRPAKLIVVGMVANGFTIADPRDAGMLDIVGFSTATPAAMAAFAAA